MPIYEYRCDNGHEFEVMQRMSDDAVAECKVCEASVERVFTPIAVHFKGSGFYATDYGSKKRARELKEAGDGDGAGKQAKDEASTTSSGSDSKSDAKADSKSDSKAEPKPASKSESGSSSPAKSPSKSSSSN